MKLRILLKTPQWFVVDKPAGMHSVEISSKNLYPPLSPLTKGGRNTQSIETLLIQQFPQQKNLPEAGIVHRLDQETSGCLLVAKDLPTYQKLKEEIKNGKIKKVYLAWVQGKIKSQGIFKLYFSSRYKHSKKVTVKTTGAAQHLGQCAWKVLKNSTPPLSSPYKGEEEFTLLQIELLGPGKRHQIRAGFVHLGHPLLGDPLYGGIPWKHGLALHAWKLKIESHTVTLPTNRFEGF